VSLMKGGGEVPKLIVVGITGGIACGKTFVAEQLRRLGAVVVDADGEGHVVLEMAEVRRALCDRWGAEVFKADGAVNRGAVARRVFAPPPEGPAARAFLEQLTHPHIRERVLRRLADVRARRRARVAVLDAPVLFEAGWDGLCDTILFVDAPADVRAARAEARGWSALELAAREAAQWPLECKRGRADVVIDNSGPAARTVAQVERFWRSLALSDATGLPPG